MKKKKRFKSTRCVLKRPTDPLDRILLRLPCYEPSGFSVELSERDALRSVLLIGQTGGGKSVCLFGILKNLVEYNSKQPSGRPGILIMDNQGDDSFAKIEKLAKDAGRESDLVHLSPTEGWYCPLGRLEDWGDLDRVTSRMLMASEITDMRGGDNRYWAEVVTLLIQTGLIVMLVTAAKVTFAETLTFLSEWLVTDSESVTSADRRLKLFDEIVRSSPVLSSAAEAKLHFAKATASMWRAALDSRTRGILRSCVAAVLKPYLGITALNYWDAKRGQRILPSDVDQGKIVVVSVPSTVEPELARCLGRLVKMDYYELAQRRNFKPGDRLVTMIQDEFPLSVTAGSSRWSDVTNLAILRSKGAFLVAATQGLSNLQLIIGRPALEALRLNFSTVLFFRCQEPEVDVWAEKLLGNRRPDAMPSPKAEDDGWPDPSLRDLFAQQRPDVPVCPVGSLARLEPHQAYVSLASGNQIANPVWFAPNFIEVPSEVATPLSHPKAPDPDMTAIAEAREKLLPKPSEPGSDIPF